MGRILKTLPKSQGKHKNTWFGPVGFWVFFLIKEEIYAYGLQMETSNQEQLTAFGVFQNLMPNWRQHIGMTIFRNQRVSQEI